MKDRQTATRATRRGFLAAAAGLVTATAPATSVRAASAADKPAIAPPATASDNELFWGAHQGGILTPRQQATYFAAFDLVTSRREDVAALLKAWTLAAARMTAGETAQLLDDPLRLAAAAGEAPGSDSYAAPAPSTMVADTGEALGIAAARLTVTFGFGADLFSKDGKDRFGLTAQRPAALVDLPKFVGDELVEAHTGGDLSVQACADDQQVAFHAVRQLARIAVGAVKIRWSQSGFVPARAGRQTPRNLMGFKDGTLNPPVDDPKAMAQFVWVGDEGPVWMQGGSYMVARRIRIALERWDRMKLTVQEQTVGRHKYSGAPLGSKDEFEPLDLKASDRDGNQLIAANAHVRLAAAATNDGAQILRRPYSFNGGVNFTAERWPPWRQGIEYDAGLLFICYQRDPRTGFVKIFDRLSKLDLMNQFVTHVGGGLFACPPGAAEGEFIGQRLFA
jgi:deferrochelatase/peroxidase EfeB